MSLTLQKIGAIDAGSMDRDPDRAGKERWRRGLTDAKDRLVARLIEKYGSHEARL
jgi:hypothetical protein